MKTSFGCDESVTNTWIIFAEECVESGQYVDFKEEPDSGLAVNRWLETLLAGMLRVKSEHGDSAASGLCNLARHPLCLYPYEMQAAAKQIEAGLDIKDIENRIVDGTLEDPPPYFPKLEV